jgi:RNA polymerase sigma-70 factor (ECF subfamily)
MIFGRDPFENPEVLIRRVGAYVAYRIGEGPEAEDVTSDVFERALRYRDTYESSRGEPIAWLIGIARRCIDDALRARRLATPEPPDVADAGDLEEATVRRLALARHLMRLDAADQELIALRYGADLTARQIGELIGMRKNAVEVALHRALARLRSQLAGERERDATKRLRRMGDEPA